MNKIFYILCASVVYRLKLDSTIFVHCIGCKRLLTSLMSSNEGHTGLKIEALSSKICCSTVKKWKSDVSYSPTLLHLWSQRPRMGVGSNVAGVTVMAAARKLIFPLCLSSHHTPMLKKIHYLHKLVIGFRDIT